MKNNTFKTFQNIMETAIKNNIVTNEALKSSTLYAEYWLASHNVANTVVRYNYKDTANISSALGFEFEDFVQELTIRLVNKFETQINAILKKGSEAHNYNGYCVSIFRSYTHDEYEKTIVRKKEKTKDEDGKNHNKLMPVIKKDELGNETKLTYSFTLLSSPLSTEETDGAEFGSILPSEEPTPEEEILLAETLKESSEHILSYLEYLNCHKSKGPMLALASLLLQEEEEEENKSQNIIRHLSIACAENPEYFVRFYNQEITFLANTLEIPQTKVEPFLATSLADFGKNFTPGTATEIAAHLSRFKYRLKVELAKLKNIDLGPKQVRRKKSELMK